MRYLALVALSLIGQPAFAQEIACNPEGNQQEMNFCARDEYEHENAELEKALNEMFPFATRYDEDLKNLGEDGRPGYEETLRKAQRAWIEYRDAFCDFEGFQARGGSLEPMLQFNCLARVTKVRADELRQMLQDMGSQ